MQKYDLTLTKNQLRIIEQALEIYMRISIGHFEEISHLFMNLHPELDLVRHELDDKYLTPMKEEIFGFKNGNIGISKAPDKAKVAYDMQKVIQRLIATVEDHHKYSVWHDGPIMHYGSEPIAEIGERDD